MARHTKTMWHHVRRSPYQAMAAVLIMMVTFLAVSVFAIFTVGFQQIISYFESKPQVTIFFRDEATQTNIDTMKNQLEASGKVSKIKFVSKEDALKLYQQQNKNDPLLLELVTADILPASLEVSTYNINDLSNIANSVKSLSYVQQVVYQQDVITTLTSWTTALRKIGIAVIIILTFVSILIMATIIGIKVSYKREEIEIMKLIGATDWYISWPFIYEGILYAMSGAFLGWGISALGVWYLSPYLASFLRGIPLPLNFISFLELLGVEFFLALILGMFSSMIAVRRYLK